MKLDGTASGHGSQAILDQTADIVQIAYLFLLWSTHHTVNVHCIQHRSKSVNLLSEIRGNALGIVNLKRLDFVKMKDDEETNITQVL